jgi:hypothetical protein
MELAFVLGRSVQIGGLYNISLPSLRPGALASQVGRRFAAARRTR